MVIKQLKEDTKNEAIFLKLDLGDLKSIKASAEEFLRCDCISFTLAFYTDVVLLAKNRNSMFFSTMRE